MIILFWSLAVISFAYFGNSTRHIDTTFAAGLLSAVTAQYGLNIKKNGEARTYKSSKYNMDMYNNLNVLTKDGYRNIIPSTIYYLKADKQEYQVA